MVVEPCIYPYSEPVTFGHNRLLEFGALWRAEPPGFASAISAVR
jgi:hypothetical protein